MIREPKPVELEMLTDIAVEHAKDAGLKEHDVLERGWAKKQLKAMMISPDYKILVDEQQGKFAGYAVGAVYQKLWNPTKHGELVLFFVHPEVRNKYIADSLFDTMRQWFVDTGCVYYQASCLMYDSDYKPNEPWLRRATTYFKSRDMEQVGYHYVQNLEMFRWAE